MPHAGGQTSKLSRPRAAGRSAVKPYFRAGDRIRGAEWYCEIAGVQGTVEEAVDVEIVDGQLVQDLLVRFDRPVLICGQPTRTFFHSAHNFKLIQRVRERRALCES